jgi:hypothetical protein
VKRFAIITILAAIVASGQADARLVATRAVCVAACGNATTETCGWIRKRGKFNRCRTKLLNQCKRFGTNVMCPTTVPVPTTTTTTQQYIPPTTTTTLPSVAQWAGVWDFAGSLSSDTCGTSITTLVDEFTITQSGASLTVTVATVPGLVLYGAVAPDGHFTVSGGGTTSAGCYYGVALEALPNGTVIVSSEPAGVAISAACSSFASCATLYVGGIVRVH